MKHEVTFARVGHAVIEANSVSEAWEIAKKYPTSGIVWEDGYDATDIQLEQETAEDKAAPDHTHAGAGSAMKIACENHFTSREGPYLREKGVHSIKLTPGKYVDVMHCSDSGEATDVQPEQKAAEGKAAPDHTHAGPGSAVEIVFEDHFTSREGPCLRERCVYSVKLAPGKYVDVMYCSDSDLLYVMQQEDGAAVYDDRRESVSLEFDEEGVLALVRAQL